MLVDNIRPSEYGDPDRPATLGASDLHCSLRSSFTIWVDRHSALQNAFSPLRNSHENDSVKPDLISRLHKVKRVPAEIQADDLSF